MEDFTEVNAKQATGNMWGKEKGSGRTLSRVDRVVSSHKKKKKKGSKQVIKILNYNDGIQAEYGTEEQK